jgi:hypothetical protein
VEEIMRATQLLQLQLQGTNTRFHAIIDDLTDEEWTTRVLPETNLMAFDLWHVARAHDTTVQLFVRGVPEVIKQARWADCGALTTPGFGLNLGREAADAVARGITRADLAAYADAVHAEISAWLETLDDGDLDAVPDYAAHLADEAVYQQDPALLKEVLEDTEGTPVWGDLVGYCIGHCRGHLAEVALFKEQLRLRAAPPSVVAASPAAMSTAPTPAPAQTVASAKRGRWPWSRR